MYHKWGFSILYQYFKECFSFSNDIDCCNFILNRSGVNRLSKSTVSTIIHSGLRKIDALTICTNGVEYYSNHLLEDFRNVYQDKIHDRVQSFCRNYYVPKAINDKIKYEDCAEMKMAMLLIISAVNDLETNSGRSGEDVEVMKEDEQETEMFFRGEPNAFEEIDKLPADMYHFLKDKNLDNIWQISVMFHSGTNWCMNDESDGLGGFLKTISQKCRLRILINSTQALESHLESGYIKSGLGSVLKSNLLVPLWQEQARIKNIYLKLFDYIFFHSLCIVEYKNGNKEIYIGHYMYADTVSYSTQPKAILKNDHSHIASLCKEFEYVWENSKWLHDPDSDKES